MAKAIKLRTDGHIEIIDVPQQRRLLDWLYLQIRCDTVETVYPRGLQEPYMMVMDEEALLKDHPVINFLGSWLYETQMHGHPICGTVLVMQRVLTWDGPDIGGIPEEEARKLADSIGQKLPVAIQTIKKKLGDQIIA
jgi:hypothetical protein